MFKKSLFIAFLLAACLQLNAAEEKFESHKQLVRHGAKEFVKATYGSIEKGFDVAEELLKELKTVEPKTPADQHALEKLEDYVKEAEKTKGTPVTDDNLGVKLQIILRTIFLLGNYKGKEAESVANSQAVQDILKKLNYGDGRESFFDDFRAFSNKFSKEVDDFLTYSDPEKRLDIPEFAKKFDAETNIKEKLELFLSLFVNIGQF